MMRAAFSKPTSRHYIISLTLILILCSYFDVAVPFQYHYFLSQVVHNNYHFSFDSFVKEKVFDLRPFSWKSIYYAKTGNDEEISNYRASNRLEKPSTLKDFTSRELLSMLISAANNRRASLERLFSVAAVRPAALLVVSLPILSTNEIADCIWCLGILYSRLRESSISSFANDIDTPEVQESHILFAVTAIQVINDRVMSGLDKTLMSRTAAKLLYGLMKLRLSWRQLESAGNGVDVALPKLLLQSVPNMNSQGVSNMLYSLGKMQMPLRLQHNSLDQQDGHKIKVAQLLVKALLQQLQAVAATKSFKGQVISNSVWGMYSLGLRWNRLPSPIRSALFAAIARECFRMSPQSVGNTLYALGKMGLRVHQLPDQMLMALELSLRKSASSMNDNDIIQVFYGLALLKFRWAQHLTAETKEVLSIAVYNKAIKWQLDTQVESAVEVATLVYSLSRLQVQWEDLGRVYRTAIILGVLSIPNISPNKRTAKLSREFDDEDIESNLLASDEEDEDYEEEDEGDVGPAPGDYTMVDEDYLSELQRVQEMVFAKNESSSATVQENRGDFADELSERFDQQLRQEFHSRRQRWRSSALSGSSQQPSSSEQESNGLGSSSDPPVVDVLPGKLERHVSTTSTEATDSSDESSNRSVHAALARSVATILYSLVAMKFDPNSRFSYTYLEGIGVVAPVSPQFPLKEKEVRLSLLRAMGDSCSFMNAQELGLAVYGLGCLEVNWWKDLSGDFREKLLSTIALILRDLSNSSSSSGGGESGRLQVIANLMFGLWKMKVPLSELPVHLRALLEERVVDALRTDKEVVPFNTLVIFLNTVTNMLAGKRGDDGKSSSMDKKSPLHSKTFRHSVLVAVARSMYSHENLLPRGQVGPRLFDFSAFSEMSDAPAKDVSLILNILGRLGIEEKLLRKYWILQTKMELHPDEKVDFRVYDGSSVIGLSRRDDGSREGVTTTFLRSLQVNDSEDTMATQGLHRYNHPIYSASAWRARTTNTLSYGDCLQTAFVREPLLARFYKLINYTANLDMTLQGAMLCLQALAKMKVRWMYIPVSVRRELLTAIMRESVVSQDASQAIAIIIHSLGKLNCKWTEMDSNFVTDPDEEYPNLLQSNGIAEALQSLLGQSIHRMDCQNLANVLSGIRDMDALGHSGRGDTTFAAPITLSPAIVRSLLDAVVSKLSSHDATEEDSSRSHYSGESRGGRSSMDSSRDRFTTDGLVALCLSLCYIDRHNSPLRGLQDGNSNSLLKGIVRAISSSCSSGTLTSIQAALLLRGLEELGWLRFLSPKSKAALLLANRQKTASFDSRRM